MISMGDKLQAHYSKIGDAVSLERQQRSDEEIAKARDLPIAVFDYIFGGGYKENTRVQFHRDGSPDTIRAKILVLHDGAVGRHIKSIPGNQINVEMESVSSKIQAFAAKRQLNPNQLLSNFSMDKQNHILDDLAPNGARYIAPTNDRENAGGLEKVDSITITDSS